MLHLVQELDHVQRQVRSLVNDLVRIRGKEDKSLHLLILPPMNRPSDPQLIRVVVNGVDHLPPKLQVQNLTSFGNKIWSFSLKQLSLANIEI